MKKMTEMNAMIARTIKLISQAITLIANGEYNQAKIMLRKAANQLDEME